MSALDAADELAKAVRIAEEAGAIVLGGYREAPTVKKKGAIDLVTEFDLASEKHIRARLNEDFARDAIVAEEGDAARAHERRGGRVWYVDPLDGTTNYAHGHPFFCVAMALWDRDVGQLGVVHAPALGLTWAAARRLGTTRNGEPCQVSSTAALDPSRLAHRNPATRPAAYIRVRARRRRAVAHGRVRNLSGSGERPGRAHEAGAAGAGSAAPTPAEICAPAPHSAAHPPASGIAEGATTRAQMLG